MHTALTHIFTKFPEKGKVKTRLAQDIGMDHAASLYALFVADIIETLKISGLPFKVCFHPPDSLKRFMHWLGNDLIYYQQTGEDLGTRIKNAFIQTFSEGVQKAIIIGSDLPDLTLPLINEAFDSLKTAQAVIGPSYDGGYYLIGFRDCSFAHGVFQGINWSTGTVFKETMKIFQESGISVHVLPEQRDIDTLDDLRSFIIRNACNVQIQKAETISYIMKHKKEPYINQFQNYGMM